MEEKLAYLEARVGVLEFIVLNDVDKLKHYISAMNEMREQFTASESPKMKELFEKHLEQLSRILHQKQSEQDTTP